jgi:hypothetical protein
MTTNVLSCNLTVRRNIVYVLAKRPKHNEIPENGTIKKKIIMLEISRVFQIWERMNRNNLFTLMEED